MSVSGFVASGVFVLVICLRNENEVMAAPAPDPCNIFLRHRHLKTTTTEPPKIDDVKITDSKRMLEEFLLWMQATPTTPAPIIAEPQKPNAKIMDMSSFFSAYIEFLTKFFNMF